VKRICLASTVDDGSLYYRAILPARHLNPILNQEGISLHVPMTGDDIRGFDAYVFYRQIDPKLFPFFTRLAVAGIPTAFDIDDNVFQLTRWSPARNTYQPWFLDSLSLCMSLADRVTMSTDRLRDCGQYAPGVVEKTTVLPNLISQKEYTSLDERSRAVQIMWAGYANHDGDLHHIAPALEAVKEKHGDRVEIIFAGHCPKEIVADPIIRPLVLGSVVTPHYPRFLSFCRPTIALAPLSTHPDDLPFNTCKSAIKWMEFSLAGAEMICEDIPPYSDVITHGETGYLCTGEDGWIDTLDSVVTHAIEESKYTSYSAVSDILAFHSWTSPARERWLDFYRSLVA